MNRQDHPLAKLGRHGLDWIAYLGRVGLLIGELAESVRFCGLRLRLMFEQIVRIGYGSQVVVIVTGAFTGAVFAAQSYFKFKDFGIESTIGGIVGVSLCRELSPVLTGLMVTGRVGASMAAEIGTMKVSEQIDALRAMGVHPVDYLVMPRLVAMLISMPLLIAESIVFGLFAAWAVVVLGFDVPHAYYMTHLTDHMAIADVGYAMIKGLVFGLLIVLLSCHQGLEAENGAVGVGQGTTRAVVYSSLAILIINFFLTMFLNHFFPMGLVN